MDDLLDPKSEFHHERISSYAPTSQFGRQFCVAYHHISKIEPKTRRHGVYCNPAPASDSVLFRIYTVGGFYLELFISPKKTPAFGYPQALSSL